MKNTKKLLAMLSALTLSACCLAPVAMNVSADDDTNTASITIEGISTAQAHTFEVYQVFTGELVTETDENSNTVQKLKNLKWGNGVEQYNNTNVETGKFVDSEILAFLETNTTDANPILAKLTLSTTHTDVVSSGTTATLTGLADGYYVIKDVTALSNADDANSAWIVQVAGSAEVTIKSAKPTVDKQVYDNDDGVATGDNNGWGESADHAINETFQFKLTATIPADENLTAYDTYKLVFHDKMSAGVTFDSIEEVRLWDMADMGKKPVYSIIPKGTYTATEVNENNEWTLTIDDLKGFVNRISSEDTFGKDEIIVEVIYNAHLNENAVVDKANVNGGDTTNTNNNSVYLEYSNNPDHFAEGDKQPTDTGKTTEDTVWVFSYEVDNTKYAVENKAGKELEGATFSLHNVGENDTVGTEIGLKWNTEKSAYMPVATGETSEKMTSDKDGKFNIMGLDAGTYYLVEETAPDGYNEIEPLQIVISATHSENAGKTTVAMTLDEEECKNMNNNIVDTKTTKLPSTGGIGRTLFYLGGGCMVAVSGILLISKKRMGRREN